MHLKLHISKVKIIQKVVT